MIFRCIFAVVAPGLLAASTPAKDLVVAADGSGDFKTVQAAIGTVPANFETRTTIVITKGTYAELLIVPVEKNLTRRGEDRHGSLIDATNNAKLNPRRREMIYVEADAFHLENLTLHNTTDKGGSQAEAIHVRADRVVFDHCDFKNFQDTFRLPSAGAGPALARSAPSSGAPCPTPGGAGKRRVSDHRRSSRLARTGRAD